MADKAPDFETKDLSGVTQHFVGSVALVPALIPAVSDKKISDVLVRVPTNGNQNARRLKVAFDGGTDYLTLSPGEFVGWTPRSNTSNTPISQIAIVGTNATPTLYEIVVNFETE